MIVGTEKMFMYSVLCGHAYIYDVIINYVICMSYDVI